MRFRAASAAMLLTAVLAVSACSAESPGRRADPAPAAGGAFPVTLQHVFGETTVEQAPQRVVALGVVDADVLLALGITPVAVAGYPFYESGLGPWAEPLVRGPMPVRLASDSAPALEQIAALAPDLIIGESAGFDEAAYERLSGIAPTVVRAPGVAPYLSSRDDRTRTIARAVGRPAEGERLIERTRQAVEAARAANPDFASSAGAVVLPYDGRYGAFTRGDTRGSLLAELGIGYPPALAARDDGRRYSVEVASEQAGLLDADVLVMLADDAQRRSQIDSDPVLAAVPVVRDGRMIIADTDIRGALTYNSVLSVPFALERLVPQLAQRVR